MMRTSRLSKELAIIKWSLQLVRLQERAEKLKKSLRTLVHVVQEQIGTHKSLEGIELEQATIYNLIQVVEEGSVKELDKTVDQEWLIVLNSSILIGVIS